MLPPGDSGHTFVVLTDQHPAVSRVVTRDQQRLGWPTAANTRNSTDAEGLRDDVPHIQTRRRSASAYVRQVNFLQLL